MSQRTPALWKRLGILLPAALLIGVTGCAAESSDDPSLQRLEAELEAVRSDVTQLLVELDAAREHSDSLESDLATALERLRDAESAIAASELELRATELELDRARVELADTLALLAQLLEDQSSSKTAVDE